MTVVPSNDSDLPGHPPSLIRVFAVRMKEAWVLSYQLSAQGWMPRLIWVFAGRIVILCVLSWDGSYIFCGAGVVKITVHYQDSVIFTQGTLTVLAVRWVLPVYNFYTAFHVDAAVPFLNTTHIMRNDAFRVVQEGKTRTGLLTNRS